LDVLSVVPCHVPGINISAGWQQMEMKGHGGMRNSRGGEEEGMMMKPD
jgi:hypothetical protein